MEFRSFDVGDFRVHDPQTLPPETRKRALAVYGSLMKELIAIRGTDACLGREARDRPLDSDRRRVAKRAREMRRRGFQVIEAESEWRKLRNPDPYWDSSLPHFTFVFELIPTGAFIGGLGLYNVRSLGASKIAREDADRKRPRRGKVARISALAAPVWYPIDDPEEWSEIGAAIIARMMLRPLQTDSDNVRLVEIRMPPPDDEHYWLIEREHDAERAGSMLPGKLVARGVHLVTDRRNRVRAFATRGRARQRGQADG